VHITFPFNVRFRIFYQYRIRIVFLEYNQTMLKNLVYFGSPEFSAEILESIIDTKLINIVGVVTTPDMPQGRKQTLTASPVGQLAQKLDLPTYKPTKLDEANLAHIKLLKPDIFLVVSYGKIIPKQWLDLPAIGTFNIHFSLLPKYRGALCISEAIKNQDNETGVTLMVMDEKLDHGPIISQAKVTIVVNDDVASLTTKLTQAATEILRHKLPEICAQNFVYTPQDEALATFTPSHKTLTHQSAFIPSNKIIEALTGIDSPIVHALIRSLNPEPGAWTSINVPSGKTNRVDLEVKIFKTSLVAGRLVLETVQLPGKNPISWKQFLSGHKI